MKAEIGKRLQQVLDREGLSQKALADRVGVSQAFVSEVVRGVSLPSLVLILGLHREFGVSMEWFLTGAPPPAPSPEPAPVPQVRRHSDIHDQLDRVLDYADPVIQGQIRGYLDALESVLRHQKRA